MRSAIVRSAAQAAAFSVALACVAAGAAPAAAPPFVADDIPMADYLGLLAQISPAAHEGAQAYLRAFQQSCSRAMQTAELRRAMSDGEGDPVLMGMIRASHLKDTAALAQFGRRVACDRRSPR